VSSSAWVVLLVIGVPLIGFLLYLLFDESFVRIEPGTLGLLLVKGRATDKTLLPGPHWVPSLRRMSVMEYPSLELSYRTLDGTRSDTDATSGPIVIENGGPPLPVTFGDRGAATVAYTVRFRLDPAQLRSIHERFGPNGLWSIVRDEAERTLAAALADPARSIDDVFGARRADLQAALTATLSETLAADGFVLTLFHLRRVDLGRAGEEIQGAVRARYELEREQADAATRLARARNDAELAPFVDGTGADGAQRYRENELWREVARRPDGVSVVLQAPGGGAARSAMRAEAAADLDEVADVTSSPAERP
jgi:SPFH domain / Band 7 family